MLDVGFNEDASRVRERNAARNLALLRKIALNFARANTTLGYVNEPWPTLLTKVGPPNGALFMSGFGCRRGFF